MGALQLLEQCGEGLHDLLADLQQVVLRHVTGVGAEGAGLADGQVLFVLFDSLDNLREKVALQVLEVRFELGDDQLDAVVRLKSAQFDDFLGQEQPLAEYLVLLGEALLVWKGTSWLSCRFLFQMQFQLLDEAQTELRVVVPIGRSPLASPIGVQEVGGRLDLQ